MVVIPGPVEFRMGSPPTEAGRRSDELQHKRRIGRTFAVSAKPVTVKDFQRFLRGNPKLKAWFLAGGQAAPLMKAYSPEANGPIKTVNWYLAAAYCNWLSEQEGIRPEQWCYETNEKERANEDMSVYMTTLLQHHPLAAAAGLGFFLAGRFEGVTRLRANYLSLTGYRLPTEAEWEYACRAGAETSRYYGEAEEPLLPRYGWYLKNSGDRAWPVAGKKPNDLGLFDMYGNVWCWCQDGYKSYPGPKGGGAIEDKEDYLIILSSTSRVLRGGSFLSHAVYVRSARRFRDVPTGRGDNVGFRPARTFR
jgi:formylglycine-generating enzyme required for sulfatase activity